MRGDKYEKGDAVHLLFQTFLPVELGRLMTLRYESHDEASIEIIEFISITYGKYGRNKSLFMKKGRTKGRGQSDREEVYLTQKDVCIWYTKTMACKG